MPQLPSFLEDPENTREAIMRATYVALCKHGYSDLTTQRIGDEFSKSKSLLYHHYDSKDDLLLEFLEFMLEQFEAEVPIHEEGSADERLEAIVGQAFAPGDPMGDDDFARALVELRMQAAHDEDYRAHFTRSDQFVRGRIASIIESGVERGVFRSVDPQETAALLHVVFLGATTERVTSTDDEMIEAAQTAFERYVRETLLEDDGER